MPDDREVVERWVQATCEADPIALSELLAPDAAIVDEPSSTKAFGPRGYLDYVSAWTGAFTMDVGANFVRPYAANVWDVSFDVRLTHNGVFKSRWGDAAPTGKTFPLTINERITVANGRVAELRVIYNLLAMLRSVGLRG